MWGWYLENATRWETPVPYRGRQGIWRVNAAIVNKRMIEEVGRVNQMRQKALF